MPTAAYYTLGCKVNQYETEKIRCEMESQGFRTVPFSSCADVYVINTCTVTNTADSKSRHAIRRVARRNPNAFTIVTGCYAELEPDTIAAIEGVDLLLPNTDKGEIARRAHARFPQAGDDRTAAARLAPRTRTRAILKVQDGCDQFCSYCAVPYARSGMQSRPIDDVVHEASALAAFGYKEVVLTGIRLGSYSGPEDVAELTRRISEVDGLARIRLSSIEVWEITERLISLMHNNPRVCRHLHIPLQSGDDHVLTRMDRPYDKKAFREVVNEMRTAVPDLAVTTDVLVGFPGETDDEFANTRDFVEEIGFSRLHVFRYSARPMTKAAAMDGQVSDTIKEDRSREMIALGDHLAQRYAESHVGRTVEVLAERRRSGSGLLTGYTRNYIETEFSGPASLAGQIVRIHVQSADKGKLTGRLMSDIDVNHY